ncbi:MAG: hypothetical protein DI598_16170, partial [Pseudopedobacter saltans]
MKISFNKLKTIPKLLSVVLFCLAFSNCVKWDKITSAEEGKVYMASAYGTRSTLTIYRIDSLQTYNFGATLAGFNGAQQDLTVNFAVDTSLVNQYNTDNAYLGVTYKVLPTSSYSLSGLSSVIKSGKTETDSLSFSIAANELSMGIHYILPIKISSVSGNNPIDSTLGVTYFKIDTISIRSRDLTSLGTLTVSNDNASGSTATEGSSKLIDNDITTKFLTSSYTSSFWAMLKLSSSQKINAYTLTSGNDASERDPKTWQLEASDDGTNWTTVDSRTNYAF